eukprot:11138729-Ditylum_brightwellii.AAC.1
MVHKLSISFYDQLNIPYKDQVWNPNTDPPYNDTTKVYCVAIVCHKKAFQSSIDTLLTEPVIVPQVDHVFDDNGSFNIGE